MMRFWAGKAAIFALIVFFAPCRPALSADPGTVASEEDVMRPTERGARLTPQLARSLGRIWVWQDINRTAIDDLTEDQERHLTEAAARHLMRWANDTGPDGQRFCESFLETMFAGQGKVLPETAAGFADAARPVLPSTYKMCRDLAKDARGILNAQQYEQYERQMQSNEQVLDSFSETLDRYARGEVDEKGEPIMDEKEPELSPEERERSQRARKVRRVRYRAAAMLEEFGPPPRAWSQFLEGSRRFFKLNEEQSAKGGVLLEDYNKRAVLVMTEEWWQKVRENRRLVEMCRSVDLLRDGPYEYHLHREFEEATEPVHALGVAFRMDIMALLTDEQRQAALELVREIAGRHGMTLEPADARMLKLEKE